MSRILKVLDQLEQGKPASAAAADLDRKSAVVDIRSVPCHPHRRLRQKSLLWSLVVVVAAITTVCVWHSGRQPRDLSNTPLEEVSPTPDLPPPPGSADGTKAEELRSPLGGAVGEAVESNGALQLFNSPPDSHSAHARPAEIDFSALERVDRQKIRLQAIVWSSIAAERKAVINEEIVWEGEIVEGHTIVAINIDEVILGRQGRLFRAILGR